MTPENKATLEKLLFSLNLRLSPTVFLGITNTTALRQQMIAAVSEGSPRYKHITIDLGPHEVYSLRDAIARIVPDEIKGSQELEYVVHFINLSCSLYTTRDGKVEPTPLMMELNFERETLFHDYPFISFIWEAPEFLKRLFYDAGDLFTWLVDRYEFEADEEVGMPVEEIPEKEPLRHEGADPKRLEQIERLERLLQQLNEASSDTQKYLRERTDTLLSLGHECTRAYRWNDAERYLLLSKRLVDQHFQSSYREAQLHFYLGELYREHGQIDKSIGHFQQALVVGSLTNDEMIKGAVYSQMGRAQVEHGQIELARSYYQQALQVYKAQSAEAKLADTYNQIGITYQRQGRWRDALEHYHLASESQIKSGDRSNSGKTHHNIGVIYKNQGRTDDAVESFNLAIQLQEQHGDNFTIGVTYHQLGIIREQNGQLNEALKLFETALEKLIAVGNPNSQVAEASIARVKKKLADAAAQSEGTRVNGSDDLLPSTDLET